MAVVVSIRTAVGVVAIMNILLVSVAGPHRHSHGQNLQDQHRQHWRVEVEAALSTAV